MKIDIGDRIQTFAARQYQIEEVGDGRVRITFPCPDGRSVKPPPGGRVWIDGREGYCADWIVWPKGEGSVVAEVVFW